MNELYCVFMLCKTAQVVGLEHSDGKVTTVSMTWLDGQEGIIPVFNDKQKAETFALKCGGAQILVFEATGDLNVPIGILPS